MWRRDVAPKQKEFLSKVTQGLKGLRENSRRQGFNVVGIGGSPQTSTDVVVNISESEIAAQAERIEDTLGQLDGQLSLKNATTFVDA